jgi:hypothetical protein
MGPGNLNRLNIARSRLRANHHELGTALVDFIAIARNQHVRQHYK